MSRVTDDKQPPEVVTFTIDKNEEALTNKVQAVLESLEKYESTKDDLFMKLETVVRCLPEKTSLTTQLRSDVLEKIDVIFLSSCEAKCRQCIQKLAQGSWKMKPYQFVEHWGYAMRESLLFMKKLIKLSAMMSFTDSVAAINAQRSNTPKRARTNECQQLWKAKHVESVISRLAPQGTRKLGHRKAKQERSQTPVLLMGTPTSIAGEPHNQSPYAPYETVQTLPQDHYDEDRISAITISSDEESEGVARHSATVYEDALRQKCMGSLQHSTSWLIEDVFDAVLPVFTSHDERILIVSPGLIDVDNPVSNYSKNIRALNKSHELLLIPLNIGKSHWVLASLDLPKRKALIYDPLHSKHNINSVRTALQNFIRDKEKFGRFSDWTLLKHPVSTLLPVANLLVWTHSTDT
jgi:hypothetical protein